VEYSSIDHQEKLALLDFVIIAQVFRSLF